MSACGRAYSIAPPCGPSRFAPQGQFPDAVLEPQLRPCVGQGCQKPNLVARRLQLSRQFWALMDTNGTYFGPFGAPRQRRRGSSAQGCRQLPEKRINVVTATIKILQQLNTSRLIPCSFFGVPCSGLRNLQPESWVPQKRVMAIAYRLNVIPRKSANKSPASPKPGSGQVLFLKPYI